jgi:hypothetical protein
LRNSYFDGTNYVYKTTSTAERYQQGTGGHAWFTAPSGTAGNAISFTQAMTLSAAGKLMIGETSNNSEILSVYDGSATSIGIIASTTGSSYLNFGDTADRNVGFIGYNHTSNYMNFRTNGAEAARIDSSGNLIQTVNTTAATLTTNQTMTISIVNNTTLKFSVRGSDGTTRSATITLA